MDRFQTIEDTVLDTGTGLMWTRDAALAEFPLSWSEALAFVEELNTSRFAGHADWKLPHRRELFSLVSHETINPSLPMDHPFANVFNGYYWTSTTCARLPDQAWYIHLGGARVFKGMKYNAYMLWPVRVAEAGKESVFRTGQRRCYDARGAVIECAGTGQDGALQAGASIDGPRFDAEDGLVRDRISGLSWLQNANFAGAVLDWQAALDRVQRMNQARAHGFSDWRLPTIAELERLTDMDHHSPALPVEHPFAQVQDFYWSATTSAYDPRYAWVLYTKDGVVGVGYKPLKEFYFWPVR
ncbi:MAG: DUF1566 domain-containing protein [Desulfobacteraceae bacterium]|jgi:hypothetical protein|nr:DUF1566 domain-containing protein [Desulfobacteraceae bacterium]